MLKKELRGAKDTYKDRLKGEAIDQQLQGGVEGGQEDSLATNTQLLRAHQPPTATASFLFSISI